MNSSDQTREPIAIIGIGCRFPGGIIDAESYWSFIEQHGDGVIRVPTDRYSLERHYDPNPSAPGKVYVKQGGFLKHDVRLFDPSLFGISPREAEVLDPQQRLLLEVTWEAIEDAGLQPGALAEQKLEYLLVDLLQIKCCNQLQYRIKH